MTNQRRTICVLLVAANLGAIPAAAQDEGLGVHMNFSDDEVARWTQLLTEHVRDRAFFTRMQEPDPITPGIVYVQFRPGTDPGDINLANMVVGVEAVLWQSAVVPGLMQVQVPAGQETVAVLDYLDRPEVLFAEPEYAAYPVDTIPDDEFYGDLWGMDNARAPRAWDKFTGASLMRVAIIDTGILDWHQDLEANIWTNPGEVPDNDVDDDGNGYVDDLIGWDFFNNDNEPNDEDGSGDCSYHGSHVSGTIGARGNNGIGVAGVNWRCDLIGIKAAGSLYDDDDGWVCTFRNTPLALEYALRVGTRMSNNSWGGGSYQQSMYNMILAAQGYHHVFVAAAGNGGDDDIGDDNDVTPHYPSSYSLSNIIAVAAINESDVRASFSNYGASSVDLGAPGVDILSSAYGDYYYYYYDGTSMATPHVTGAIALLQAAHNNGLTWFAVRDRVNHSVRPLASLNGRTVTGGTLDINAVLDTWANLDAPLNGTGSRNSPFNGFAYALGRVPGGFTLMLHPSSEPWTGLVTQPVTLNASGGSAVLGR